MNLIHDSARPKEETRSLRTFLKPASIAVVGASEGTEKVGGRVVKNLLSQGYGGKLIPVNSKGGAIHGLAAVTSIDALPEPVDLAFICIPAEAIPEAVEACARKGIANVLVGSSGFGDAGEEGRRLQEKVVETARSNRLNLAGPNSEGFFNVTARIAATFSPAIDGLDPGPADHMKRVAVVAQSGGIAYSFYSKGRPQGLAFSTIVAVGNQGDLEAADYIEALIDDEDTAVILVYLEGVKTPARFLEAASRAADAGKPLVVARVGQSEAGRRAVASHTGSLAGSQAVWEAVAERYGIIRAAGPEEMLDLAAAFTRYPAPAGNRLAVITVSGGTAAWMVDLCALAGMSAPPIEEPLRSRLLSALPSYGAASNPIDVAGHNVDALAVSLEAVLESPDFDAVVMILSLAFDRRLRKEGGQLAKLIHASRKPVYIYSYTEISDSSKRLLESLDLPTTVSMETVARSLSRSMTYCRFLQGRRGNAERLTSAPSASTLLSGEGVLCEYEARAILETYGVPSTRERLAHSAEEAVAAAREIAGRVAMKVQSPQIPHKTEAKGVRLGLTEPDQIAAAYRDILACARAYAPAAEIRGVLVQAMAAKGVELVVGAINDPEFGPMMMCGSGGLFVEAFEDVVFAPAPLSKSTAEALLTRVKGSKLLEGFRGSAPADRAAVVDLLVRLSEFAFDARDWVAEIDLNPVVVHPAGQGLSVVDALIVTKKTPLGRASGHG